VCVGTISQIFVAKSLVTPSQDASSARFNLVALRVRVRAGIKTEQKTRQYIPEEKTTLINPYIVGNHPGAPTPLAYCASTMACRASYNAT
jgi:hypothetical protein